MNISWSGLGNFTITGKPITGEVTVITDPFQSSVGLRAKSWTGGLVVSSHDGDEANNVSSVEAVRQGKHPFVVTHAGEYESQGVFVQGIHVPKADKTPHTIYRITMEGVKVGFLGALDRALKERELELLGDIDILLVPVGGNGVLDAKGAAEVVAQVEPRVVIPAYFEAKGLKKNYAGVEVFAKELGNSPEEMNKYTAKKGDLPVDDMELVVLSRT